MSDEQKHNNGPKIAREKKTVERMINFYCRSKHDMPSSTLCDSCTELLGYSHQRLDHCRYGEDKPTCRKCEIHCYRPVMRNEIRSVMRFSGPRLALRAPVDWVRHWVHEHT